MIKSQIPNHKLQTNPNNQIQNSKRYDLEERTFRFAQRVIAYVNMLPKITPNHVTGTQLIRSSGSAGANYIEANEALSKKDFIMRIKISRKEAKESSYWLRLTEPKLELQKEKDAQCQEATELTKIFSAILGKCL